MKARQFLRPVGRLLLVVALCSPAIHAAAIFVRMTPPHPFIERIGPRPGPRYVLVGGYYRWSGRAYVWVPGRWVVPPRPHAVWVAPHWDYVASRQSYLFVAGYWR